MEQLAIKKVTLKRLNIALDEPFTIAIGKKVKIENVLIILELANGIKGYGEAAPLEPINGENQATVFATLKSSEGFLKGKNVSDYKKIAKDLKNVFHNQVTARCAVESVFTAADAINIVKTGCADVVNIKLMKSGIIEALDIAAIARSANIRLMIGCMLETKLALGCAVHFAAGIGGFDYVDLDPHLRQDQDPFSGGPAFAEPFYEIDNGLSGIGVSLNN